MGRRTAVVAVDTVGDVIARWDSMYGSRGVGLRGGRFSTRGDLQRSWTLHRVRWVTDAAVSGTAAVDEPTGKAHADLTIGGSGVLSGHLHLSWNAWDDQGQVVITGVLGGHAIHLVAPAP
jgi:hypothetical protein